MMKREQTIIIPAYKPSIGLIDLAENLASLFLEIIVVDDGSGAEYIDVFERIEEIDGCTLIKLCVNMGKGSALKTAFNYFLKSNRSNVGVITVDADGQHKIEDIVNVADEMNLHPDDLILGCRSFDSANIPARSRFGNKVSCVVYRWLCGIKISDTQTGLRGIPLSFLPIACATKGERYEYETNMLIEANNEHIRFKEVQIETIYEDDNLSSHFNPIRDSINIYSVLIRYSLPSFVSVIIDYFLLLVFGANSSTRIYVYITIMRDRSKFLY